VALGSPIEHDAGLKQCRAFSESCAPARDIEADRIAHAERPPPLAASATRSEEMGATTPAGSQVRVIL